MSSQNVKPLTGKKKKKRNTFCNLKCLYCTIKYISIYHIYHFCLVLTIHVEAINRYTVAFQLSSVRLNACSGEVWFISPRLFSVCSGIGERAGVLISKIYSLTLTTPPQLTWTPPPSLPPSLHRHPWEDEPVSFLFHLPPVMQGCASVSGRLRALNQRREPSAQPWRWLLFMIFYRISVVERNEMYGR